jgi:RHS repeat-associated protein
MGSGGSSSVEGPGLQATWTWAEGQVVAHEVNRRGFIQRTRLERDESGRVTAQIVDGLVTRFSYDAAGQLAGAQTSEGSISTYSYDRAGRLVAEAVDGATTRFSYDAAGQLIASENPDGTVTSYTYDGSGRRIREVGPAGERLFGWDPRGFLTRVTAVTRHQDTVTGTVEHRLTTDALGELARADGQPLWWDTTAARPSLAQFGAQVIVDALAVTAAPARIGENKADEVSWLLAGEGSSPWSAVPSAGSAQSGVSLTSSGGLQVSGMEWMGARVYDPGTRGFLSRDPVEPVTGAAWAANPYSFAGNDPVNHVDPWGLSPVTADQLKQYADQHRGGLASAWHGVESWWGHNWQYVAAGAMVCRRGGGDGHWCGRPGRRGDHRGGTDGCWWIGVVAEEIHRAGGLGQGGGRRSSGGGHRTDRRGRCRSGSAGHEKVGAVSGAQHAGRWY